MKIDLKTMHIENFMSFKSADLVFDNSGFVQIIGQNTNSSDGASSNGSGKSSLFEAVCWALTGETIRGVKKVKNLYSDEGAIVDIFFVVEKDSFRLIRTQDHSTYKSSLTIYKNNEDVSGKGIRDSEKILTDLLPDLTPSLLGSVVVLGQGLPQRFTNNTPSGRKEVLESLSKSDFMIDELTEKVNKRSDAIQKNVQELKDKINQLVAKLTYRKKEVERSREKLNGLQDIANLKNQCNKIEQEIDREQNDLSTSETGVQTKQNLLNDVSTSILSMRNEQMTKEKEIRDRYFARRTNINNRLYLVRSDLSVAETELNKILSIKEICPTCKQKIANIIKPDPTLAQNKVKELLEQKEKIEEEILKLLEDEQLEAGTNETLYLDKIDALNKEYSSLKKDVFQLNATVEKLKSTLDKHKQELYTLNLEISEHYNTRSSLKEDIEHGEVECEELNKEILYHTNEIEKWNAHQQVVSKMQTALKRDFRGILLSGVISYIAQVSKEYASIVFNNSDLDFYLDGNNLQIALNGKLYETLSGGEKQKVDIIVQLALRKMLCTFLNFSCNIICFDEIFDNCDVDGCKAILNLITKELTDIDTIYVITHHIDIDIPCDYSIIVKKDKDNYSYIER